MKKKSHVRWCYGYKHIDKHKIQELLDISESTVWRYHKKGDFGKPIKSYDNLNTHYWFMGYVSLKMTNSKLEKQWIRGRIKDYCQMRTKFTNLDTRKEMLNVQMENIF